MSLLILESLFRVVWHLFFGFGLVFWSVLVCLSREKKRLMFVCFFNAFGVCLFLLMLCLCSFYVFVFCLMLFFLRCVFECLFDVLR